MISRKEHLKQVNRFHDLVENISELIEKADDKEKYNLALKYFKLTAEIWPIVDDNIENIKIQLDKFEYSDGSFETLFIKNIPHPPESPLDRKLEEGKKPQKPKNI